MRVRVMLVRDGSRQDGPAIDSPKAAYLFLHRRLRRLDREHLIRLDLDGRNKVLGYETVSIGTLTASLVHPREVLKGALLANAAGFILAHHPSGDTEPSPEDKETTRRLKQAADLIGIPLVDHMIVTDKTFFSFREKGLL